MIAGGGLAAGRDGRFLCGATAALDDAAAPVSAVAVRGHALGVHGRVGDVHAGRRSGWRRRRAGGSSRAGSACRREASAARDAGKHDLLAFAQPRRRADRLDRRRERRTARTGSPARGGSTSRTRTWRRSRLGRSLPAFNVAGEGSYDARRRRPATLHAAGQDQGPRPTASGSSPTASRRWAGSTSPPISTSPGSGTSLRVGPARGEPVRGDARGLGAGAPAVRVQHGVGRAQGGRPDRRPGRDLGRGGPAFLADGRDARPRPRRKRRPGASSSSGPRTGASRCAPRRRSRRRASRSRGSGRPIAAGLDVSAFVLADYAPQGWQVQLAPFEVRSDGDQDALAGGAPGQARRGGPAAMKAAGSWSASAAGPPRAARARPGCPGSRAGTPAAASRPASDRRASCSSRWRSRELGLPGGGPLALPSITSDIRADFEANGRTAFSIPLHLDYGARTADLMLSGTVLPRQGRAADRRRALGGGAVGRRPRGRLGPVRLTAPPASRRPSRAPALRTPPPFWPAVRGRLSVRFKALAFPRVDTARRPRGGRDGAGLAARRVRHGQHRGRQRRAARRRAQVHRRRPPGHTRSGRAWPWTTSIRRPSSARWTRTGRRR